MRSLKKYILCLIMVIPMLVLLAHDIIPHNHHVHQQENNHVSVIQIHQHAHSHNHGHSGLHWNHSHNTTEETCCILTHNRVQKEIKYQIFLKSDEIKLDSEDSQRVQQFKVYNSILIPEPLKSPPLRRGPPSQHLA